MPAVMRACAVVEQSNVPSVAIGGQGFEGIGKAFAKGLQIPYVPIVTYPGGILVDNEADFAEKAEEMARKTIEALLSSDEETSTPSPRPALDAPQTYQPRRIVYRGDFDAVQEHFLTMAWSDGMPVVPPTLDRVEAFLATSNRSPFERLGVLAPAQFEATPWNVAVNGVMAGCRPEYFPVLLAIAEAVADEDFRVEFAGSTPGWEPLVTVSGPLVESLGFNTSTGVMRVGRQANTSIGRFLRLYLNNVAGFHIPPGETDQGAIGATFNVALAEDDRAPESVGWAPYRLDHGYDKSQTIVTVRSVVNISAPIYSGGTTAEAHLRTISQLYSNAVGPWYYLALAKRRWHPLLVMSPYVARAIAADGYSKDDVREYVATHTSITISELDWYAWQVGSTSFNAANMARRGELPDAREVDGEIVVPLLLRPGDLDIIVAGSPQRNQSRIFVGNHQQGPPVTRVVEG